MTVDIFQIGIDRLKKERRDNEKSDQKAEKISVVRSEFNRILDVIICGSIQSGKSTLINRFLDRTQSTEPTFGLCYKFASRTRVNSKELANLWELGNAGLMAQLLQNCFNENNISTLSVVLFLDMSKPETFESTLRPLIDVICRQIEELKVKVANTGTFTLANNAPDGCFAIGVPIAIVGSHYDEFQNFDTEKKRNITKLLRFLAHINGASLMMYSIYQEPLVARGKALLNQFGFDATPTKTAATDIHKPICIPAFSDTLEDIGLLGVTRAKTVMDSHHDAMEIFYTALNEQFKQEPDNQQPTQNADDDLRQFAEPQLDIAIEERYRELVFLAREQRSRT
ncbi:Cytoplasmic dynein 2 light intermediate chain 1 [Aphelenchoides besseyi]|nr:Cytoplasmic dynein 2 light intermediate chain 1 [Aphelenchoides besseyi]